MDTCCRICSRKQPFEPIPLSSRPATSQETICDMLTYCTQLEVSPDDSLPQQICCDCLKSLTGAVEFKRLCHQSDASFRQKLQDKSLDEVSQPTSQQADTYRCCFTRCDRKTSSYAKLQLHAKMYHQTRQHGNLLRRREDHIYICSICMGGFSTQHQWKIHRALLEGVQRYYRCIQCKHSYRTKKMLDAHLALKGCRKQDNNEEDRNEATGEEQGSLQQSLIRRILKAQVTDGLVRINQNEYETVQEKKAIFLKMLHRKELKRSGKRVKVFYVCETCQFRTEIRHEVIAHLNFGNCVQGFYMALGFRAVKLHYVQLLECKMCNYRTENSGNLKRHQLKFDHSGIRKSKTTKQVAQREYPCEYCGRVLTKCSNRTRHRRMCSRTVDAMDSDRLEQQMEQQPSPDDDKRHRCEVCNYSTDKLSHLKRHLRAFLKDHESIGTDNELVNRDASDEGKQLVDEKKSIDVQRKSQHQDLVRRILNAKPTNGLVRISEEEHETVLKNRAAFLKWLHRNEFKHSCKRVKVFYVCEACNLRTESRDDVVAHLDIGVCIQGFYVALGFRILKLRCVQIFECKTCDHRTENTGNLRRHQMRRNHSGIRTIRTTKPVPEREYPCEYCRRVFTTSHNRKRHRSKCLHVVRKTTSAESKELPSVENVSLLPDSGGFTSNEECEEQQESLITELKIEECDSLEAINDEDGADPPTEDVKRVCNDNTLLNCSYSADQRDDQDQQLKMCVNLGPQQAPLTTQWQDWLRRIMQVKPTHGLARISDEEHDTFVKNKTAFVEWLYQSELKHSSKRVKLFYVCEACNLRTESRADVLNHLEIKTCTQGFYKALGLRVVKLRSLQIFECKMCGVQTANIGILKRHQQDRNHVGILSMKKTKQVAGKEYPCISCGRVLTSCSNRTRHRRVCSRAVGERNPNGRLQLSGCEEQHESEVINRSVDCQGQEKSIDVCRESERQDLVRRIMNAKGTSDLVRINEKEHETVLKNGKVFLKLLHRNELKDSRKRVRLFYVCEACNLRAESREELVTHLEIGTCLQGFYMALGFRVLKLRCLTSFECKMCGYHSAHGTTFKRHQQRTKHVGILETKTTKEVAEREYPCEYCGRIFTTFSNRKRHRESCSRAVRKTISDESKQLPSHGDVSLSPGAEETTSNEECEEQQESLITEIKIEEYDPLAAAEEYEADPPPEDGQQS